MLSTITRPEITMPTGACEVVAPIADYNDVPINRAIQRVYQRGGGSVYLLAQKYKTRAAIRLLPKVHLCGSTGLFSCNMGTFNTDGAISLGKVTLDGNGTRIIKNCNDYAIECVGVSGTEIVGAGLRNLTVTRAAADTNDKYLVNLYFADRFSMSDVCADDAYSSAIYINYCDKKTCQDILKRGKREEHQDGFIENLKIV